MPRLYSDYAYNSKRVENDAMLKTVSTIRLYRTGVRLEGKTNISVIGAVMRTSIVTIFVLL